MKKLIVSFISLIIVLPLLSQNIAITDDNSYIADPSSMLDVKSLTKGMLVPRLTSIQISNTVSPF